MARKLRDLNTSEMMFDPNHNYFVKKMKTQIKECSGINAHNIGVKEKSIFEYVALMYDLNSPLWREVPDYYQRKYEAAAIAQFPAGQKGEFSKKAEKVMLGQVGAVNNLIVGYIAAFALPEYFQMVAYTAMLSYETKQVVANKGTKDSLKNIETAGNKIKDLQRTLFKSGKYDEATQLRKSLYQRLDNEKLKLRPEEIIKALQEDGKLSDDYSPYEEPTDLKSLVLKYMGEHKEKKG